MIDMVYLSSDNSSNPVSVKITSQVTSHNPGKKAIITNEELKSHGCLNCIWKSNGQCINNFNDSQSLPEHICQEYLDFLLSFADDNDSSSALWEKFNIYLARLQTLEDYKDYKHLEFTISKAELDTNTSKEELRELEIKRASMKLWWLRMNDLVTKSLGRVVDRESRSKDVETIKKTISISDLNKVIRGELTSDDPVPVEYKDVVSK